MSFIHKVRNFLTHKTDIANATPYIFGEQEDARLCVVTTTFNFDMSLTTSDAGHGLCCVPSQITLQGENQVSQCECIPGSEYGTWGGKQELWDLGSLGPATGPDAYMKNPVTGDCPSFSAIFQGEKKKVIGWCGSGKPNWSGDGEEPDWYRDLPQLTCYGPSKSDDIDITENIENLLSNWPNMGIDCDGDGFSDVDNCPCTHGEKIHQPSRRDYCWNCKPTWERYACTFPFGHCGYEFSPQHFAGFIKMMLQTGASGDPFGTECNVY